MIERGDGDDATKAGQRHNLMQMIGYAEDELECRRKMLLGECQCCLRRRHVLSLSLAPLHPHLHPPLPRTTGHFKEHFTKQMCKGTCDNCRRGATSEEHDVSAHAKAALRLVHEARTRLTLTMVADTLKGSTRAELAKKRLTTRCDASLDTAASCACALHHASPPRSSLPLQTTRATARAPSSRRRRSSGSSRR